MRRRGDDMTLTIKSGPGMTRTEEELAIDARRFESLWPLTEGRRVNKTRHLIPLDGDLTAELDVYSGAHDGLLTAEIEFPSVEASEAFEPPAWLGRDVTGDGELREPGARDEGPVTRTDRPTTLSAAKVTSPASAAAASPATAPRATGARMLGFLMACRVTARRRGM